MKRSAIARMPSAMKITAALALLAAALTAPLPLFADTLPTLVPPAGWKAQVAQSSTAGTVLVGIWAAPVAHGAFADIVNLVVENTQADYDAYVTASRVAVVKNATGKVGVDADESCATGNAHRFEYVTTFGTTKADITQLVRVSNGTAFIATYGRPPDAPADPAALASLRSLCG